MTVIQEGDTMKPRWRRRLAIFGAWLAGWLADAAAEGLKAFLEWGAALADFAPFTFG